MIQGIVVEFGGWGLGLKIQGVGFGVWGSGSRFFCLSGPQGRGFGV